MAFSRVQELFTTDSPSSLTNFYSFLKFLRILGLHEIVTFLILQEKNYCLLMLQTMPQLETIG